MDVITPSSESFLRQYLNNASPTGFESSGQRLWLDYLLSPRGQQLLSKKPGFYSVRAEVPADEAAEDLRQRLGLAFRPIVIGTNLLAYLDQMKRRDFLRQWHETIAPLP